MSKRTIKFGKWNGNPLEWDVLYEDEFKMLVVCRSSVAKKPFDSSSSRSRWIQSGLRKFLQEEFLKKAFSVEERQKIVNTKLNDVENAKDNIFILSTQQTIDLLGDNDNYGVDRGCKNCTWTRSSNGNEVYVGYAHCHFCSINTADTNYNVRPAMYLKKTE